MKDPDALLELLNEYDNSPEGRGFDLRLGLADVIFRCMDAKGWSQKQLAAAAQMKPSQLSRILHGKANVTLDVAGRLLFALGSRAEFVESPHDVRATVISTPIVSGKQYQLKASTVYGEEIQGFTVERAGEEAFENGKVQDLRDASRRKSNDSNDVGRLYTGVRA